MPSTKIVNEDEVRRWFEEGRTYEWMTEQYRTKYNVEMTPSAWGNYRRRRGLTRRTVRDESLIPSEWHIRPEHRYKYPVRMLRLEGRARAGQPIRAEDQVRHRNFIAELRESTEKAPLGWVIDYRPDDYPEEGFVKAPRKPSDADIVRRPRVRVAGGTTRL